MTLKDELARRRQKVAETFPRADLELIDSSIERLRMLQLAEHSLATGEILPDFALSDPTGITFTSTALLARGPLVVAFFRGAWCPYCDATLRALEAARPTIEQLGATLVGISPARPDELAHIAEERGIHFALLSDIGGDFARLCGVAYEVPEEHVEFYRRVGVDLEVNHAGAGWALPLPATYVVGCDGTIGYAFVDPDWACRAEPDQLVAAVSMQCQAGVDATSD